MLTNRIHHLPRAALDAKRWDACINQSPNGLIYASSSYLDALCTHWDALVYNNYEAVMPLPWRKKWGVAYVYTPSFCQQLGVISAAVHPQLVQAFQNAVVQKFRYGTYLFNFENGVPGTARNNFILPLNRPYSEISGGYSNDLRRNLKKAAARLLVYSPSDNFGAAIRLFQQQYQHRMQGVNATDFKNFEALCSGLPAGAVLVRAVYTPEQTLAAVALCLKDTRRLYLLMTTTLPEGRKYSAMHFLTDRLIQEFSAQQLTLDFEGSDLPGVRHFYENFGGWNQPYVQYHWNLLPWPLPLLKP